MRIGDTIMVILGILWIVDPKPISFGTLLGAVFIFVGLWQGPDKKIGGK